MAELTEDDLKIFSEFQRVTGIYPLDSLNLDFSIVFIVQNRGELYKCFGKGGVVLNRLAEVFRKPVFIYLHSDDPEEFVKNAFSGIPNIITRSEIKHDGKKYVTLIVPEKDRGRVVGREGRRIKSVREVLYKRMGVGGFQLRTTKQTI